MSSMSSDEFTMKYIEIQNGRNRTWKIDGAPFDDWVDKETDDGGIESDWFVVPEEFSFRSKLERKFWS